MADPLPAEPGAAGQTAALQAGFRALQQRFVAGLPQRWRDIESAADPAARAAALHRLAGAAGSFGLTELSDAAGRAEQACRRLDDAQAGADGARLLAQVRSLIDMQLQAPGDTVR